MIGLIFNRALEEYKSNFKVMLSFGILFVFVILFLFFNQFFLSSGTVFLSFSESIITIVGLVLGLIFLYVFSFFISLTVYSIKRDMQRVNFDVYWNTLLKKVAVKVFLFYFFISIIIYAISVIGLFFAFEAITAIISLVIVALLMYVPQSIILEEKNLKEASLESLVFWKNNFLLSISIIILGAILLSVIFLIEFALELVAFPGIIFSFIFVLIFVVPFIEQVKSYSFILKFDLIKQPELLSAEVKPKKPQKINAVRLRERVKGGKI